MSRGLTKELRAYTCRRMTYNTYDADFIAFKRKKLEKILWCATAACVPLSGVRQNPLSKRSSKNQKQCVPPCATVYWRRLTALTRRNIYIYKDGYVPHRFLCATHRLGCHCYTPACHCSPARHRLLSHGCVCAIYVPPPVRYYLCVAASARHYLCAFTASVSTTHPSPEATKTCLSGHPQLSTVVNGNVWCAYFNQIGTKRNQYHTHYANGSLNGRK